MDVATGYKTHTLATLFQGVVSMIVFYVLSVVLLQPPGFTATLLFEIYN